MNKTQGQSFYKVFSVAMVFIGTVIGAGFASGKEVYSFFGRFGVLSIPFILLVFALLFITCYGFLSLGDKMEGESIMEMNKLLLKKFSGVIDVFVLFSHGVVLASMIAGLTSLSYKLFPLFNFPVITIMAVIFAFIFLISGLKKIVKVNAIIVPLTIILILVICFVTIQSADFSRLSAQAEENGGLTFVSGFAIFWSSLLYVGMNMLTASPVVCPAGRGLTFKQKIFASLIGSGFISLCLLLIMLSVFTADEYFLVQEMPLFALGVEMSSVFAVITSVVIVLAIFTTLITSAFALEGFCAKLVKSKPGSVTMALAIGVLISLVGFSNIVSVLYPVMGAFGVIYIIAIALSAKR